MPWTVRDVEKHKKGLTDAQKRQWVAIANAALAKCLADGGNQLDCEASAIRQASGVVGRRAVQVATTMAVHHIQTNLYAIRSETHQGRAHIVVPIIMMVEGVHEGSAGCVLHLAEELGACIGAWDGIPVVVQHPEDTYGRPVSANAPDVIDRQAVGRVYNTRIEGDRLKAEAWLDEEKLRAWFPETLEYIQRQHPLDVSVGVFSDDEATSGVWCNEDYAAIARNYRPDHLALLPGGEGACSWADGCGVRANAKVKEGGDRMPGVKEGGDRMPGSGIKINAVRSSARRPKFSGTSTAAWSAPTFEDCKRGMDMMDVATAEDMTAAQKRRVAGISLLGNERADTFDELVFFPVVNPGTGELSEGALRAVIGGRGAQADIPDAARISARRMAYRLLNSEFDADLEVPETLAARKALAADGVLTLRVNEQGYRELMGTLQSKLDRMDNDMKIHFLTEVFEDYIVYEVRMRHGGEMVMPMGGGGNTLYRWDYQVNADDTVEFVGEPAPVRRQVEYVTQAKMIRKSKLRGGEDEMTDKDEKIVAEGALKAAAKVCPGCLKKAELLIQAKKFDETDREWLVTSGEARLDRLITLTKDPDVPIKDDDALKAMSKEQAATVLKDTLADPAKFMTLLPEEVREQIAYGIKLHQAQRQALVAGIMANTKVYTEDELKAMKTEALEKLSTAIKPAADYSGLGAGGNGGTAREEEVLLPPHIAAAARK